MGKINVLSFEIANLIAAGEVVERPSSVLKELLENSIDAGATRIVAEIKKGGVSLIRVTDNGSGIEKEDLPVALKRHATSKIREKEDLDGIITLGFRGEALAAISSVSEVTIITKTKKSDTGYMLTSEGGNILDVSEVGCSDGTTVVVENLFYNVPARRKFLKKDSTEAMNVTALLEKVALSRPDVSIQLLIDGEEKFSTPGDGDLLGTIRSIFGKDFASKLISINGESDGIRVSGYIGRSDNVRKNRNLENVFINGRYVKSLTAQAAIEKAFTSYIAPECFPVCALFIEMNPGIVDVNVHPAKLEVKFSDERRVFEAVYYTVKRAIETCEYRPEMSLGKGREYNSLGAFVPVEGKPKGEQISFGERISKADIYSDKKTFSYEPKADLHTTVELGNVTLREENRSADKHNAYSGENYKAPTARDFTYKGNTYEDKPLRVSNGAAEGFFESKEKFISEELTPGESLDILKNYSKATVGKEGKATAIPLPEYKFVGEAFDCYIIIEQGSELLVIDKHAAHERVIFEDLKRSSATSGNILSQTLLLPITALLTPDEMSAVKEYEEDFKGVGFDYSLSDSSVDIYAIPDAISTADAEELFVKMAGDIVAGAGNPEINEHIRREKALYQIACKAAIKGGREYTRPVIDWIIGKVLQLPDITVCPHGRPIAYKLKKSELDRQFNRIK